MTSNGGIIKDASKLEKKRKLEEEALQKVRTFKMLALRDILTLVPARMWCVDLVVTYVSY